MGVSPPQRAFTKSLPGKEKKRQKRKTPAIRPMLQNTRRVHAGNQESSKVPVSYENAYGDTNRRQKYRGHPNREGGNLP